MPFWLICREYRFLTPFIRDIDKSSSLSTLLSENTGEIYS
jgi:hypothetical protein